MQQPNPTSTVTNARHNEMIDERIGPVVYWPEAFHFALALGELMTKAMTGMRRADIRQILACFLIRITSMQISPPGVWSATAGLPITPFQLLACKKRKKI